MGGNKKMDKELENAIKLARLKPDPKEKKTLVADVEKILDFVKVIKKSKGVKEKESSYPQLKKRTALREDRIVPFKDSDKIIKGVPFKKEKLISVKKI